MVVILEILVFLAILEGSMLRFLAYAAKELCQKNPAPSSEGAGDEENQCGVQRSATDYWITFYSPKPMGQRRDFGWLRTHIYKGMWRG